MAKKYLSSAYKKRRKQELLNAVVRKAENERLQRRHDVLWSEKRCQAEENLRAYYAERRPLMQQLVNVLAGYICYRDPRYVSALGLRNTFTIANLFGVGFPTEFPCLEEREELPLNQPYIDTSGTIVEEKS